MVSINGVAFHEKIANELILIIMDTTNEFIKTRVRFFRILLNAGFEDITREFHSDYRYSEEMLADYDILMKRAFKKGTYIINCDYGDAYISIGEFSHKIGYSQLTDKLIALVIFLAGLKNENSRYKFGRYITGNKDMVDVYDEVMTSYPYNSPSKRCKQSIEDARIQLPRILDSIMQFS